MDAVVGGLPQESQRALEDNWTIQSTAPVAVRLADTAEGQMT